MKRGNNEGTIYRRRSDRRFVAAITVSHVGEKRVRKTATAATKPEAVRKLSELQQAAEQGLSMDDPTVAAFLQRWLTESAKDRLRPRTFAGYATIVNTHLAPGLGQIKLRKLSVADVDVHLRRAAESGLSNRTCQYIHAVLRSALAQAERWDLVPRNVAKLVTPPRPQRRDVQPLTPDQARAFLDGVQDDRLSALYRCAATLGLRQGELLGLVWADVDFDARTASVRHSLQRYGGKYHLDPCKTDRSRRTIALPPLVADALRRHRVQQNEERLQAGPVWSGDAWGLVFCNEAGEPLDGTAVTRAFQQRLADLGLPALRFHDLRHGAATVLLSQGVSLPVVMQVLGHSSIATTVNVYGHLAVQAQQDALEKAEAAVSG